MKCDAHPDGKHRFGDDRLTEVRRGIGTYPPTSAVAIFECLCGLLFARPVQA